MTELQRNLTILLEEIEDREEKEWKELKDEPSINPVFHSCMGGIMELSYIKGVVKGMLEASYRKGE